MRLVAAGMCVYAVTHIFAGMHLVSSKSLGSLVDHARMRMWFDVTVCCCQIANRSTVVCSTKPRVAAQDSEYPAAPPWQTCPLITSKTDPARVASVVVAQQACSYAA